MDKKKPSNNERGNVRYLWVLVGAYLLYLAWQQLQLLLRGEAVKTGDIILCVVSGSVFAAVGAWVIYREWRAWQYAQAHKDDPETWGDAPEEDKTSADAPESDGAEIVMVSGGYGGAPKDESANNGETPENESEGDSEEPESESEGDSEEPESESEGDSEEPESESEEENEEPESERT